MTRIGRTALALSVAVALTMATMHAGPKDQLVILEATVAGIVPRPVDLLM